MRNLKAIGLALVAMLALGAFASAAQAEGEGELTSAGGTYPLILGAETNESEKFTAFGKEVTCQKSTYSASIAEAPSSSVTITPTYSECHVPGPFGITLPATVTLNNCGIVLYHATTDPEDASGDSWNLTTEVQCENAGETIEIHVYASKTAHSENKSICTQTVTQQTVTNGPTATNNTVAGTVTLSGSVTGLHAVSHNSSSLCPEGTGEKTTANAVQDLAAGGVVVSGSNEKEANPFHIG